MINDSKIRNNLCLFPSATCNLNCRYCNISKNPALLKIDQELAKSFENPEYYLNRIKQYFPQSYSLKTLEFWGGETFLNIERVFDLLPHIIENYPFLYNLFSSTNFSFPEWPDKFFSLMQILGKYKPRNFRYVLQLSCDGPEYINDQGRGEGVTKKCLQNFDILCQNLENKLPSNVMLNITIKQTLDINTIKLLTKEEKIIEYYKFFEDNFIDKIKKLNFSNVQTYCTIPNVAVPVPATVEDGKIFANFCKISKNLNKKASKIFKYYNNFIPFRKRNDTLPNTGYQTYNSPNYLCGCGTTQVNLLPNNLVTICNEGFTQITDEYFELANKRNTEDKTIVIDTSTFGKGRRLCMTDDEYAEFENFQKNYYRKNTKFTLANISSFIVSLALANQVDRKYLNFREANRAAAHIMDCSYCIKDNYNMTGSISSIPAGMIKLLCNGALDYILEDN